MSRKVTARQRRAIEALLSVGSITKAAEIAFVSRRQLHRWLHQDDFLAELAKAESAAMAELRLQLAAGKDAALLGLMTLLRDAESESVRRAASSDWVGFLLRLQELAIEQRLAKLEEMIYAKHQ